MDLLIPRNLRHARTSLRYLDSTGVSRGTFTGALVTAAKGGDRLGLTFEFTKHGGKTATGAAERAQLRSFLASLRGRQNRAYLQDLSYKRRGSFPTGELLSNNYGANGTTGWTASTNVTLTAADRAIRATISSNTGANPALRQAVTVAQYVPYAIRCMVSKVGIPVTLGIGAYGQGAWASDIGGLTTAIPGLTTAAGVTNGTSATVFALDGDSTGIMAGHFFEVSYMSLARCALIDAGQNLLQRSDEFDNAYWTKNNVTVGANLDAAPDATTTSDRLLETSATGNHYVASGAVTVSSAALDYSFSIALLVGNRSWAWLQLVEATGSTVAIGFFNVFSGVVGSSSVGANWSNVRLSMSALGSGWYQCTVTARKTNAATSITVNVGCSTADSTTSYAGTNALIATVIWRATLAQASVPARLVQTTSAATTGVLPIGSTLYLKGLPASTTGLLEIDDQVELVTSRGSELKLVTLRLNSDGAGLGQLQFEPPIRTSPADNAAVIINQPMGRFLFTGDQVGFDNSPGFWSESSAEFEEAI